MQQKMLVLHLFCFYVTFQKENLGSFFSRLSCKTYFLLFVDYWSEIIDHVALSRPSAISRFGGVLETVSSIVSLLKFSTPHSTYLQLHNSLLFFHAEKFVQFQYFSHANSILQLSIPICSFTRHQKHPFKSQKIRCFRQRWCSVMNVGPFGDI